MALVRGKRVVVVAVALGVMTLGGVILYIARRWSALLSVQTPGEVRLSTKNAKIPRKG